MKLSWVALTFVAGAVVAAGCGNNYNNNNFGAQCDPPNGVQVALVYPAPGSTGIPDDLGGFVVLGSTRALPSNYGVVVQNNATGNAAGFGGVGPAPSPIPSPFATPAFASPVYQASGSLGATFVAGSQLTVYFNDLNNPNCAPTLTLGSFKVQ